jgi:hypothetical protein
LVDSISSWHRHPDPRNLRAPVSQTLLRTGRHPPPVPPVRDNDPNRSGGRFRAQQPAWLPDRPTAAADNDDGSPGHYHTENRTTITSCSATV